jgi:NTE family protein
VELRVANYFPMGSKFAFGVNADVLASNRKLLNTYYASIINAPSFTPSASMEDVFNLAYHANSFVDVGIVPIWKPINNAQVRVTANMFMPFQKIEQNEFDNGAHYGAWFSNPEFTAELDLIYTLPFASICGYVNWLSYPSDNWNVGLSFGLYFTASKFLR